MIGRLMTAGLMLALTISPAASAITWPWEVPDPWPHSSNVPVATLDHPNLIERTTSIGADPAHAFHFVVFGDQRILADGEWQEMISYIDQIDETEFPLSFMLDTGDIVWSGNYSDQFSMLRDILSPVKDLPYLVSLGNHETKNNSSPEARENSAAFLAYLDPMITKDRFYYQKQIGQVRFIFLDTNDLVYGDDGSAAGATEPLPGSRAEAQMAWLVEQLGSEPIETAKSFSSTVVVMHHPFIQSSKKHRSSSIALWEYAYQGRTLPDILLDGGVKMILVGHTHTYERYLLERNDGRQMHLVNLSGRPRTGWLRFGERDRRAHDISGEEADWLTEAGWRGLDRWEIGQVEVMAEDETDQFALFSVDNEGSLTLNMFYLDDEMAAGWRRSKPVRLR